MGNVLPSDLRLHRRYDLKGSTYGRTVSKAPGVGVGGTEGSVGATAAWCSPDMCVLPGSLHDSAVIQLSCAIHPTAQAGEERAINPYATLKDEDLDMQVRLLLQANILVRWCLLCFFEGSMGTCNQDAFSTTSRL